MTRLSKKSHAWQLPYKRVEGPLPSILILGVKIGPSPYLHVGCLKATFRGCPLVQGNVPSVFRGVGSVSDQGSHRSQMLSFQGSQVWRQAVASFVAKDNNTCAGTYSRAYVAGGLSHVATIS